MAPTTLVGQRATTAQSGRNAETQGYPIRVSEMLATLTGAVFVERVAVDTPAHVRQAKSYKESIPSSTSRIRIWNSRSIIYLSYKLGTSSK